ncbi:hypothetical protein BH20ACT15_BH20ACT15_00180 [soil metagenome]
MGLLGFGKKELGKQWSGPAKDLAVTVTPAGGGPALEIRKPRMISEGSGKTIYEKVGTVEPPAPGTYVAAASMTVRDEHHSPRIVARA